MMTKQRKFPGVSPVSGGIAGWSNESKKMKQKSNQDLDHLGALGSTGGNNSKRSYKIQNITNSNFYRENPSYMKNSRAISPSTFEPRTEKFQFGLIPVSRALQSHNKNSAPRVASDFDMVPTVDGQEFFPTVRIGAFQYHKKNENEANAKIEGNQIIKGSRGGSSNQ